MINIGIVNSNKNIRKKILTKIFKNKFYRYLGLVKIKNIELKHLDNGKTIIKYQYSARKLNPIMWVILLIKILINILILLCESIKDIFVDISDSIKSEVFKIHNGSIYLDEEN